MDHQAVSQREPMAELLSCLTGCFRRSMSLLGSSNLIECIVVEIKIPFREAESIGVWAENGLFRALA
jgi:hypothetical protein